MRVVWTAVALMLITGCAAHYTERTADDPYGLLIGIWHGFVFPYALVANVVSWVVSLVGFSLMESIQIIGRPNTGVWYYIGFALGLVPYGSGSR